MLDHDRARTAGPGGDRTTDPEHLRAVCAWVASRARDVWIDPDAVAAYAAGLELGPPTTAPFGPPPGSAERDERTALWLTLDAVNFGSGWSPTLIKRAGSSGHQTIALGIRERFECRGPWSANELAEIGRAEIAAVVHQDPEHELMELFARSLRDLGARLVMDHGASFSGAVSRANGSAVELSRLLAGWECFVDVSTYEERPVPFLKRAQIAAIDLHRSGAAKFRDIHRLTMFADNLVPHVLRLDGVLAFVPELVARIEREELIAHGSPEEVEIRACAVHAVELLVAVRSDLCAADIDQLLWERGGQPRYKASPRHRSRCTAY